MCEHCDRCGTSHAERNTEWRFIHKALSVHFALASVQWKAYISRMPRSPRCFLFRVAYLSGAERHHAFFFSPSMERAKAEFLSMYRDGAFLGIRRARWVEYFGEDKR